MYVYNPDRRGLSEVKLLKLEPWRLYPTGKHLNTDFLKTRSPSAPRLTKNTSIASMGSCFAREIKEWLVANDYNFIQTASGVGTEAGSARYDRVYNTFTVRQEFERAFDHFDPEEKSWELEEGGTRHILDPYRKGMAWESKAEMERELVEHAENVRKAFGTCDILVLTIGQAEIWYNRTDGYVYPLVPPAQIYDADRHGFRMSTFSENLANLERSFELFEANNPTGHLIVTVSPVPLRATFRNTNSVVADVAQKSMLRAVVDEFVANHGERVTYFPSYEIVTLLEEEPYLEDNRHVQPDTVGRIMDVFESWFVSDDPVAQPDG
ncbi:MAG TPA: GSCFA domain-containing protein [Candidatus Paceibacterota bacterium]|nr:GSCFA domain-containing protein [Candidatus Paceibacterota bacterium]